MSRSLESACGVNTMTWGKTLWKVRNTEAMLQVRYDNQSSKQNTLGEASDFDAWVATIGVRHLFEPIKLRR